MEEKQLKNAQIWLWNKIEVEKWRSVFFMIISDYFEVPIKIITFLNDILNIVTSLYTLKQQRFLIEVAT